MQADRFADPPFDAVAHHGFPEGAGSGEPDVRSVGLRFTDAKGREEGPGDTGTGVIYAPEVFGTKQTYTFGKTGDGILPFGTDGQLLTATSPATRENRSAILGFHASEKAVRFGAVAIIRLKSTFWHLISSI